MATIDDEDTLISSYGSHGQGNMDDAHTSSVEKDDSELLIPCSDDSPKIKRWLSKIIRNDALRDHIKPFLASVSLTLLGVVCILVGIIVTIRPVGVHAWVFFFIGSICLIPGAYHLGYIVCILQGREGYTWNSLRTLS